MAENGADALLALSKRLKAAGRGDLRKEFTKAVQSAAKPLIPKVREAARRDLPKRGGLNERIARKSFRTQVRTGASTAGVRITASGVDPRIDEGRLFHPVFGRKPGVVQNIKPGYFSDTLSEEAPKIAPDIVDVLADWAERIVKGGV
jgi:hypothetical protein